MVHRELMLSLICAARGQRWLSVVGTSRPVVGTDRSTRGDAAATASGRGRARCSRRRQDFAHLPVRLPRPAAAQCRPRHM